MKITPLPEISENTFRVSISAPAHLIQQPGVKLWIHAINSQGLATDSDEIVLGVKSPLYNFIKPKTILEMDTSLIKAEGSVHRPIAYITNNETQSLYGQVSLLVNGESVYQSTELLLPGQTQVGLKWNIPKLGDAAQYDLQAQVDLYGVSVTTTNATIGTYIKTKTVPIDSSEDLVLVTDETGKSIARPALIYASNQNEALQFKVTAPDGTCVIGPNCLVTQSTADNRGGLETVKIQGQTYRIKYSGESNALERFSVTSFGPILGDWKVEMIGEDGIIPSAYAGEEVSLKIKYRAEKSQLVTISSMPKLTQEGKQYSVELSDGLFASSKR